MDKTPELWIETNNSDNLKLAFASEGITPAPLIYSLFGQKINLYDVPFDGKVKFAYENTIWNGTTYESPVLIDPTWYAIMKCANQAIIETQDFHHVFLEVINFWKMEDDVHVYELVYGS